MITIIIIHYKEIKKQYIIDQNTAKTSGSSKYKRLFTYGMDITIINKRKM